jgi:hypothetical protein
MSYELATSRPGAVARLLSRGRRLRLRLVAQSRRVQRRLDGAATGGRRRRQLATAVLHPRGLAALGEDGDDLLIREPADLGGRETIDASDPDGWVFPVGTRAWKEFPRDGRRIETRLFAKVTSDRWQRATYLWSADGETAVRTDDGIGNWEGTGYEIPPVTDCDKCHQGRRDRLLGVEAIGLAQPGATGVTLEALVRDGRLVPATDPTAARLPEAMPAAERAALAWLHINCGVSCHSRAADARAMGTDLFLRLELGQLAAAREGVGALDPVITTVGVATRSARWPGVRVVPGGPARSQLFRLASSRGAEQMPPLLTHLPDPTGNKVLQEWIESLPASPSP